jgi:hypothetical protein
MYLEKHPMLKNGRFAFPMSNPMFCIFGGGGQW